jgi:hypothetical protein
MSNDQERTDALPPNSCDDDSLVRGLISDSIRKSPKSRAQIVEAMSHLLGQEVTEAQLNAFTAPSKAGHRWPSAWDRAFCVATGDYRLLVRKAELAGFRVIDEQEYQYLQLGKTYIEQKRAAENMARLENNITRGGKNE